MAADLGPLKSSRAGGVLRSVVFRRRLAALLLLIRLAVAERVDSPSRCSLPMTALRETPPMRLAITPADWPSAHIFTASATRSSVHSLPCPHLPAITTPWLRRWRAA